MIRPRSDRLSLPAPLECALIESGDSQHVAVRHLPGERHDVFAPCSGGSEDAVIGQQVRAQSGNEGCQGVISPLLANVYLHDVLDKWIEERVKPKCRGKVAVVRYADDLVILFRAERDARAVYAALYVLVRS